jgi:ATP-binding cassette subfamily C (CFTR/MRP) protein 1
MDQIPWLTSLVATGDSMSCQWPLRPISQTRDLDLTSCFEHAVLLPLPLVVAIVAGAAQMIRVRRRMKKDVESGGVTWQKRGKGSELVCRLKMVSDFLDALTPDTPRHLYSVLDCRLGIGASSCEG